MTGTYKDLLEQQFYIAYHSKGITWSCVEGMARVERVQTISLLNKVLREKKEAIDKASRGKS